MSGVFAVDRHVDDRSGAVAVDEGYAQAFHKLVVAGGYFYAVHLGNNSVAADFLNVADTASVRLLAVGTAQALAYRMGGCAFRQSCVFNKLCVVYIAVMDSVYLKDSLSEGAGLIENDRFGFRKQFEIV